MLEKQTTEIDGHTFMYQPMMLTPARALFDKLAQRFGPAIASAIEGLKAADINADMQFAETLGGVTESAGGFLRSAVAGLDPKFHKELADELAKSTSFQGPEGEATLTPELREVMFGVLTEYKLIWWCLSVQYADFLEPLGRLSQQAIALRGMAISASVSQPASTGSSTESPSATNTPIA